MADRAGELVAGSYARATGVAVIIIVTVFHVGFTLPRRLGELSSGRAQAGDLVIWLALTVIGVI
ncbi:MAG: hypothetical protein ACRD0H_14205, partial [Actinomycetes bacterium]